MGYKRIEGESKLRDTSLQGNMPEPGTGVKPRQGEFRQLARELGRTYRATVASYNDLKKRYPEDSFSQSLTDEKIDAIAYGSDKSEQQLQEARESRAESLQWGELGALIAQDQEEGLRAWQAVLRVAHEHLDSGTRAFDIVSYDRSPWFMAQFRVILRSFEEAWKPKDAIELALVEMLAQSFVSYGFWQSAVSAFGSQDYKTDFQTWEHEKGYIHNPDQKDKMLERAYQMADRYHRQFLRGLRTMRDLRRFTVPVINNGGQVNIATDGGQQVNVQAKDVVEKKARRTR